MVSILHGRRPDCYHSNPNIPYLCSKEDSVHSLLRTMLSTFVCDEAWFAIRSSRISDGPDRWSAVQVAISTTGDANRKKPHLSSMQLLPIDVDWLLIQARTAGEPSLHDLRPVSDTNKLSVDEVNRRRVIESS